MSKVVFRTGEMPQEIRLEVRFRRGVRSDPGLVGLERPDADVVAHEEFTAATCMSSVLGRRKQPDRTWLVGVIETLTGLWVKSRWKIVEASPLKLYPDIWGSIVPQLKRSLFLRENSI